MYKTGRLCMKIAGRDAGKFCVVINEKDGKVLVEGQTRRRYVNPAHLEPLKQTVDVKADASREDVQKALEKIGITVTIAEKRQKKQKEKA